MPVTAEHVAERDAALHDLAAAHARLDAAHAAIAAELSEGEIRVLTPTPVPVLIKQGGRVVEGTLAPLGPSA